MSKENVRILALVPGAFGAHGGIAQYNRDLFSTIATSPSIDEIVILPRIVETPGGGQVPPNVSQLLAPSGRATYAMTALQQAGRNPGFDVVFCGHLNLAGLAMFVAQRAGAKLWLQVHGVEAWAKPSRLIRRAFRQSHLVTAVSRFTRSEMTRNWWESDPAKIKVLPNTVRSQFAHGPKNAALLDRYKLHGRRTMLTVSRISESEHYKGHDRVIAAMPRIREVVPDLAYLVVGDGDGVCHLKSLARQHGQENHVIFAGHVADDDLVEHYRTADLFVMPSMKEGFGIVFLEAAACGLPVIGGKVDGSWDALMEGRLGVAVDPVNQDEIVDSVINALSNNRQSSGCALGGFRFENFRGQVQALLEGLLAAPDDLLQMPEST